MDDTSSDSQGSNRSSFDYRSDESDNEHCSFESKLKLVDFDIHDEMNSDVLSDIISLMKILSTITLKQRMEQEHSGRLLLM